MNALAERSTIKVDLRVIAATNKNLEEAIEAGEFRQDLYYRLNVVSLEMPPLRDRREDIMLLANYFADKYGAKCNRKLKGFSAEARECLDVVRLARQRARAGERD